MGLRTVFVCISLGTTLTACGARSSLDILDSREDGSDQQPSPTTSAPMFGPTHTGPTNTAPATNVSPKTTPTNAPPMTSPTATDDFIPTAPPPTVVSPEESMLPAPCTDVDAPTSTMLQDDMSPRPNTTLERIIVPSVCGDGRLFRGETCDDGNVVSGDGCNANCQTEPYYECLYPGKACTFVGVCGDGAVAGPEQCEPPRTPGCSISCEVIDGWVCPLGQPCLSVCGDGLLVGQEQCDDGNNVAADGCEPNCTIDWRYCNTYGCEGSTGTCGDGNVGWGEGCDYGPDSDLCSEFCQPLPECDSTGCAAICGDGVVISEGCDDGNVIDGDGCSSGCEVEPGFQCTLIAHNASPESETPVPPEIVEPQWSQCSPLCGDGIVVTGEPCDLGDLNGTGGHCRTDCTLGSFCGDGFIDEGEYCDDGRNIGHPSDPASCPPGCAPPGFCGDAVVQTERGEQCDQGKAYNDGAYEGCTSFCTLAARCGDEVVQACGGEQCEVGRQANCIQCRLVTTN